MEKQLPKGWALSSLDVLVTKMANGANATQFEETVGYPISRIETIWNGDIDPTRVKYIKENDPAFFDKYRLQEGDILFSHINSDNHIGKTAIYKKLPRVLIHGINLLLLRFSGQVSSSFFNYQLKYMKNLGAFSAVAQRAVNQSSINQTKLKSFELLLPPFCEQKRIVAKIEELFSELDKGIESLTTAREQLKVYRQAVLKHAFEGKLTEQWRKDNADKLETPEQLLARIQQERETRYQQQLEKWKVAVKAWEANGKEGKKPGMPKTPEQALFEKAEFKTPSCWATTRLGLVTEVNGGLTKNQKRNTLSQKMKYLRVANVYADKLLLEDIQEIGVTEAEAMKVSLALNDLLVVEGNGSVEQIGRVALWDGSIQDCGHQNHLIRVRFDNPAYARFVLLFLLSPIGRDLIVKEASSTSGLHTLSISKVSNLPIPLVSLSEADEIIKAIDEKLSLTSKFESEIETEIKRAETLRQSILKKAFSGQLVPQDPNDEPARELLARIQAEKAASDVKAKKTPAKRGRKAKEASE